VTLEDLAEVAGCSRWALYRSFREFFGFAPSEYQRDQRMRAARAQLRAGVTPADAAVAAGFADQAHLTRWFRRTYGVTPSAYQRLASGCGPTA
jgi:AraC-like DNA-binding protein